LQCATCRLVEAPASDLPFTAGTMQAAGGGGGGGGGGDGGDGGGGGGEKDVKFAVAARAPPNATTQVAGCPAQSPDQPPNENPVSGVAVSDTDVPSRKFAEQLPPQLIPPGELVTCPCAELTERLRVVTLRKLAPLAPELSLAIIVTSRVPGVA
jgi:hypothetical protein